MFLSSTQYSQSQKTTYGNPGLPKHAEKHCIQFFLQEKQFASIEKWAPNNTKIKPTEQGIHYGPPVIFNMTKNDPLSLKKGD